MKTIFQIQDTRYTYGIYFLVAVCLTWITFGSLSDHLFDASDDREHMVESSLMTENLAYMFSPDRQQPIRPTADLATLIGYFIWGGNPGAFHLLLVGFHLLACLLLAYTLQKLGVDLEISLISALLFLMNVAHFRSVHWITLINYNLAFIFGLIVLICHAQNQKTGSKNQIILGTLALGIAILSHPSEVSIVLFCAYLTWHKTGSLKQTTALWPLFFTALLCGCTLLFIFPNERQDPGLWNMPDPFRIGKNLLWYLGLLFSSAHWFPERCIQLKPTGLEMGFGLLACLGTVLLYRRRIFPAADWGVWTILAILPFVNNPSERLFTGPSRQLYFSSDGSSVLLALGIRTLVNSYSKPRYRRIVATVLLIGILSSSFFSLKKAEAVTFYISGRSYVVEGQIGIGIDRYQKALKADPLLPSKDVYPRLIKLLLYTGQSPQEIIRQAQIHTPDDPLLNLLSGIVAYLQRDPKIRKAGDATIQKILKKDDPYLSFEAASAYQNLAAYYHRTKQYQEAINLYQKALQLSPNAPLILFNLGNALYAQGKAARAVQIFAKTVQIDTTYISRLNRLGETLSRQGQLEDAVQIYQSILQIYPNHPVTRTRLRDLQ